jgi:hypothetical protein
MNEQSNSAESWKGRKDSSLEYYCQIVEEYFGNLVFLDERFTLHQEPRILLRRINDEKIDLVFDEYEIEVRPLQRHKIFNSKYSCFERNFDILLLLKIITKCNCDYISILFLIDLTFVILVIVFLFSTDVVVMRC